MNCLPLLFYPILLLDSVLGSLPAPVNLFVRSVNFQHLLRWDPGPGTPPGTHYKIFKSWNKKIPKELSYLNTTSLKLKLRHNNIKYVLTVQACYDHTLCYGSSKYPFTPYSDTTIGPPKVSLAGCGNCIHINVSLPEADRSSGIADIQAYYNAHFTVSWRKPTETQVFKVTSNNKSYTLNNLQIGTEYCIQVDTDINLNKNTEPSAWKCSFTSIMKPSRDPAILGAVAALLILVISALVCFMYCLHYTGFLCKLKATPRVLIDLVPGYTLAPERTIPDKISFNAETEKHNNPTTPQPTTWGTYSDEEDEGEEEEEEHIYMDRDAELCLGQSSCEGSVDVSGNCKVAASGGSESLTAKEEGLDSEFNTYEELDQDEAKAEAEDVSFMPEGDQTGVQGQVTGEEEEKEVVCESSGHINLFSVTLAALAVYEEEEEHNTGDSLIDFLKLSDLEPLLPTGSQTESDDLTTVAIVLPTQKDFTVNGYEGRCADVPDCLKTCDVETQHKEEEEEEEFAGYMRHT